MLGVTVGALIRNQVGAIVALVAYVFAVDDTALRNRPLRRPLPARPGRQRARWAARRAPPRPRRGRRSAHRVDARLRRRGDSAERSQRHLTTSRSRQSETGARRARDRLSGHEGVPESRVVMVAVSCGAIAVVAATLVCGCGGGKEQKQLLPAADVTRIAGVGPVAPGWTWPRDPEKPAAADSSTESAPNDPLLVRLKRQMAGLVDIAEASNEWRDDNKLGHLDLGVFGSADDAGKAFAASNAFSRGWGARSGHITKAAEIDGLGDEAWVVWVGGPGTQVTYLLAPRQPRARSTRALLRDVPGRRRCRRACVGPRDRRGGAGSSVEGRRNGRECPVSCRAGLPGTPGAEPRAEKVRVLDAIGVDRAKEVLLDEEGLAFLDSPETV